MLDYLIYAYGLYFITRLILSILQIDFVSKKLQQKAILLNEKKYKLSGNYSIAKEKISIISHIIDFALFMMWITFGLNYLQNIIDTHFSQYNSEIFKAIFFVVSFSIIADIASMPISIYQSFVLDKKYGFSKNLTVKTFILDTLKGLLLFLIIAPILVALIAYFISSSEYWWFYSFVVLFTFIILANILYPIIRAKMFDKFTPLSDGELKTNIENLLSKVNFRNSGIYSVDASKRDSRLNAYFAGLGKTKRVVLFDTLIEKLSINELISVLGHELGHFKNKDIIKNIFAMGCILFFVFYSLANIPEQLAVDIGIKYDSSFIIIMFLFLSSMIFFAILPFLNSLSRHNEYEADKVGSELGDKKDLANALIKLITENLSFPHSHPCYILFYYSHPPLVNRLKELGEDIED